jgi:hypothetical protein
MEGNASGKRFKTTASMRAARNPVVLKASNTNKRSRFDNHRFRTEENEAIFKATMSKRGVLKERQFILTKDDCFPNITGDRETNDVCLGVYNALKRRKWKTLCSLEGLAYGELVAEFYSNLKINDNDPI